MAFDSVEGGFGTGLKTAAPLLSAVPYVGPILSMGAGIAGGLLEQSAAKKQQEQAAKAREEALGLKPANIQGEFYQKFRADKAAELAGLPGKQLWQNMLDQRLAGDVRSIRESAPTGAAALAAASAAMGRQSSDLNTLAIKDAEFKAMQAKDTRNTLWDLGLQKNRQEDIRNVRQREGLTAASALENAATYNKQNAINKILGTVGGTASAIASNVDSQGKDEKWMQFLMELYGNGNQSAGSSYTNINAPDTFNVMTGSQGLPTADTLTGGLPEGNFTNNSLWSSTF